MAVQETSAGTETRETMDKNGKNRKQNLEKMFLIGEEIKLAKFLAGNNKQLRDKALKGLKKWFRNENAVAGMCSVFTYF